MCASTAVGKFVHILHRVVAHLGKRTTLIAPLGRLLRALLNRLPPIARAWRIAQLRITPSTPPNVVDVMAHRKGGAKRRAS